MANNLADIKKLEVAGMPELEFLCTIIIPAYNAEKYLGATIESVLVNIGIQIVIVNDGSKDFTLQLALDFAKKHSNIEVVDQVNQGVSAARNSGLERAKGKYVLFLDSDDLLSPSALGSLSTALESNPQAVAVFGRVFYIDTFGKSLDIKSRIYKPFSKVNPDSLIYSNFLDTLGAILIRTEMVRHVGGFDEELTASEDWEFYNRLIILGDIQYVDIVACRYRIHTGSAMSNLSLDAFRAATVKVLYSARKRKLNRLKLFNASARQESGLLLMFLERSSSTRANFFLSIKLVGYTLLSFPFYFSAYQLLKALKLLFVDSVLLAITRIRS